MFGPVSSLSLQDSQQSSRVQSPSFPDGRQGDSDGAKNISDLYPGPTSGQGDGVPSGSVVGLLRHTVPFWFLDFREEGRDS